VSLEIPATKQLGSVLSSPIFWKRLCRIDVNSALNSGRISPAKPAGAGGYFHGFLKKDSNFPTGCKIKRSKGLLCSGCDMVFST
jgi:hypothetical protein